MRTCTTGADEKRSTEGGSAGRPGRRRRLSTVVLRGVAALAAWTVLAGALAPAMAQDQTVRIVGRVQWIAAEKMMVIPDDGGLPIDVDITQVGQDQYEALTEGSPVVVVGVVSPDGRRLIATSISSGGG